jgi:predicted Zn-dependent protease
MTTESYTANYQSALSYLKLNLKDPARETLKRALSQVSQDEMREDNPIYLGIVSTLAILSLEQADFEGACRYVDQGLSVKKNHLDLLFIKALLLMDQKRYDEMLEAIIHYLLAKGNGEEGVYQYRYAHEGALKEVYDNLLPTSYRLAFQQNEIKELVRKLSEAARNEWLKKACEVMDKMSDPRNQQEH